MLATPVGRRVPPPFARASFVSRRSMIGALAFAAALSLGCNDNTTDPATVCTNIQDLTVGVPVSGTLAVGDCLLALDNSYADHYRFVLTATTMLQIDLTSTEFDAYIYLNSVNGTTLNQSDDGGDDDNARMVVTLAAGTYHVLANSFLTGETGAYQLTVAVMPP